jgi:hypothetical protein
MIGQTSEYDLVHDSGKGYGVYRRTRDGKISFIIARIPRLCITAPIPPSSALAEFTSNEKAVDTLMRWTTTPSLAKALTRKTMVHKYQTHL